MTVSYARGPSNVDWEDRVDIARLRRDRVRAVGEALDASDLDGLLLWKDENVRYLTSLRAQLIAGKMTSLNGVLLTRGNEPVLLCSGGEIDKARQAMASLRQLHPSLHLSTLREFFPTKRDDDFTRWREGLQAAGLPD